MRQGPAEKRDEEQNFDVMDGGGDAVGGGRVGTAEGTDESGGGEVAARADERRGAW